MKDERELKKKAIGIVNQLFDLVEVPVEKRQEVNDKADEYMVEQLMLHNVSNRFSDPKFIDNVCLSYRHDFGLLSEDEQNKVRFECKEWMRAIKNNEPY